MLAAAARRFSVAGMDSQSYGRSEGMHGLRSYIERFDDLAADVVQFVRWARSASHKTSHPARKPCTASRMSHSAGRQAYADIQTLMFVALGNTISTRDICSPVTSVC